jgi:hypothetical protein
MLNQFNNMAPFMHAILLKKNTIVSYLNRGRIELAHCYLLTFEIS